MGRKKTAPKMRLCKDGKLRNKRRIEITLTEEDETMLDLMWMEFESNIEPQKISFSDFLALLLRRQIDRESKESGNV